MKIDGALIHDIAETERSRMMIGHLVEMCGAMGLKTVAEMVETPAQAEAIKTLGVDYAQGWLYGRPTKEPVFGPAEPVQVRRRGAVESWG